MASAASTFTTFQAITGPSFLTGPEGIVNEAAKTNYLLGRFLRESDMSYTLQGGASIKDSLQFDEQSTFQFVGHNATLTPSNPQTVKNWTAYWRQGVDHMSWTDMEIELQVPSGLTQATRHEIYKKIKFAKEMRLWTSKLNGMENALFAVPETADMESQDGLQPYSIFAHVNEWAYGLFYSRNGGTTTGKTAWTTKQGIDPVVESRWRPRYVGDLPATGFAGVSAGSEQLLVRYNDESEPNEAGYGAGNTSIFHAFDNAWAGTQFEAPPTRQAYFESPTLRKQLIACSFRGQAIYKDHLRRVQDLLSSSSRQDPQVAHPAYAGIDVIRVEALGEAAVYPNATVASAPVTEMSASAEDRGPRYYFLNGNYLAPVYHARRYFEKHEPMRHRDQPFTTVQWVDTWYNAPARSLRRHTIVGPNGASVITA